MARPGLDAVINTATIYHISPAQTGWGLYVVRAKHVLHVVINPTRVVYADPWEHFLYIEGRHHLPRGGGGGVISSAIIAVGYRV